MSLFNLLSVDRAQRRKDSRVTSTLAISVGSLYSILLVHICILNLRNATELAADDIAAIDAAGILGPSGGGARFRRVVKRVAVTALLGVAGYAAGTALGLVKFSL